MCTINLNSLTNKLCVLNNLFVDEDIAIAAICETWLISSMSSSFVELPGFAFFLI